MAFQFQFNILSFIAVKKMIFCDVACERCYICHIASTPELKTVLGSWFLIYIDNRQHHFHGMIGPCGSPETANSNK